jgi:hypothetical protein
LHVVGLLWVVVCDHVEGVVAAPQGDAVVGFPAWDD